jgi:hypothetical protein
MIREVSRAGAPKLKWSSLLEDEKAVCRMAYYLMTLVSDETDAIHLASLERAKDLIKDLLLAAERVAR